MPGILPMKVIKVGSSSTSRIAQACDRCRSKKIRCDGVTPCCTQCKNVGFECKTSDKLSRRAFPRGYTESLEERVRALEAEVRDLKSLLDERDEKIDLLSKIHSFSSPSRRPSNCLSPNSAEVAHSPAHEPKDDMFKVRQVPFLQKGEQKQDAYFMGASSARAFFDAVKCRISESGKSIPSVESNSLFGRSELVKPAKRADFSQSIPCVTSDHLINVFFQEWSPLFPVLHRPTFLEIYKKYSNEPESIKDPVSAAQLHLVFGIASLASESNQDLLPYLESQWQGALGAIINDQRLQTLQCIVLAQIYCMAKGDYNKLQYYTGVAVNLSNRLGLHQTQKRFSFGALTRETRKKVFWSLYTLDAFGAAALGLPKLMKDADIETEEPADVDDENVNERGFQSTLPGESTKLSSALALFRAARILSKALNELYPATSSHELSLSRISALSEELDAWRNGLAPHLRLEFVQDKPSTNVISSRCPLLSLAYFHIRSLIHRPVLNSGLPARAQQHLLIVADSSKHILQIVELLHERSLSFTMCINKMELLTTCGLGLLLQLLDLPSDSKIYHDTQVSLASLVRILESRASPTAPIFKKLAAAFHNQAEFAKPESRRSSSSSTGHPPVSDLSKNTKSSLQAIAARFSFNGVRQPKKSPYLKQEHNVVCEPANHTVTNNLALYARVKGSTASLSSTASDPALKPRASLQSLPPTLSGSTSWPSSVPNLDYLPLDSQSPTHSNSIGAKPSGPSDLTDWDQLISTFDPFDISAPQHLVPPPSTTMMSSISPSTAIAVPVTAHGMSAYHQSPPMPLDWSADWSVADTSGWGLLDMLGAGAGAQELTSSKSVLSLSEESLTSGEELSTGSCEIGSELRGYSISHEEHGRAETMVLAQGGDGGAQVVPLS